MNKKELRCPVCNKKLGEADEHLNGSIYIMCNRCKEVREFKEGVLQ